MTQEFRIFETHEALSRAAKRLFVEHAHQAIDTRGRFVVALSGGSTPKRLFEGLAEDRICQRIPWNQIIFVWSDERAVPPDHEFSNYRLAHETLLSRVPVLEENILRFRGELGAQPAAEDMRQRFKVAFGHAGPPRLDLAVLGMGADGHTASLFPGSQLLETHEWVVPVPAPAVSPTVDRITLTLPVLNNARTALFLASGAAKAPLIREIRDNPRAGDQYPAARVAAPQTLWFVDQAALGDHTT